MVSRTCQEDWLTVWMKQIHKSVGRIFQNLRRTFVKKLLSFWKQALKLLVKLFWAVLYYDQ